MKVKAIQSFIGRISMNVDDEREVIDKELAKDLIRAGYVVEMKAEKEAKKEEKEIQKKSNKNKKKK